jgi:hypothetical protein
MPDLAELTVERDRIKAKLNRMKEIINNFKEGDDLDQLRLRRPDLISAYKEFDKIQSEIEPLSTSRDQSKAVATEWINFETLYYNLLAKIAKFVDKQSIASENGSQPVVTPSEVSVKLPDLNLPSFSGNYSNWTSFHDTFQTLIHTRTDLNNCQKFHYLKSCLKGDAFSTVEALSISSGNYQVAWELLEKRYNNLRLIVQEHVNSILSIHKISKASNTALRQLINNVNTNIEALKILKQPTDKWDALLVPIIIEKLDYGTNREWQSKLKTEVPALTSLIEFLEQRCLTLEALENLNKFNVSKQPTSSKCNPNASKDTKACSATQIQEDNKQFSCYYCKNPTHTINKCAEFLDLSHHDKIQNVNNRNLCKNCLRPNHSTADCRSKFKCKYCHQNHNSLLHQQDVVLNSIEQGMCNLATPRVNELKKGNGPHKVVLLSTALIYVKNDKNNFHKCSALLDVGSQSNIITESLAKKLKLNLSNNNNSIQGINQKIITSKQSTTVTIKSRVNTFSSEISCLVLPKITGNIPEYSVKNLNINIPEDIQLADPNFYKPFPIDLLLGAGLFWKLLGSGKISAPGQPHLIETSLGWLVGGEISKNSLTNVSNVTLITNNTVENQLQKFWEIEEYKSKSNWSPQEDLCETHFLSNHKRDFQGRFIVKLPFVKENNELGSSKEIATKRLHSLEHKFKNQPLLKLEYSKFMNEYLWLNHMELVPNDYANNNFGCYLPHHEVFKQSSGKLRVVFDASAKTSNGKSLNNILCTGPTIQQDLFSILTRFRTFEVAFTGDIVKMYRQIKVDPEHCEYQRILWRENPEDPILTYRLLTVTYGTTCAPFLAVRCLQQAALEEKNHFPTASEIILRDFYMDDLLTGASSVQEATKLKQEINHILNKAGFEMSKWASTSVELMSSARNNEKPIDLSDDQQTKTLGVVWDYNKDLLTYQVNLKYKNETATKRLMLSVIAQLWDPLGLISPIIIKAKLILQKMWSLRLSWDERVPDELHQMWTQFISDLMNVNNIKVNRKILTLFPAVKFEIHGFCDSSQSAYGATIFIRSVDSYGNGSTNLLCSKSRVAPLKTLTIPRLELCGSLLLVRLMQKVLPILNLNIDQRYFWTDSSIVLSWIAAPPNTSNIFVANRVSEIQSLSELNEWRHISTKYNPADIVSRGMSSNQLKTNDLWWHGPEWLRLPENKWPKSSVNFDSENIPEKRKSTNKILFANVKEDEFLTNFSKFIKLQRVVAFIKRVAHNCRNKISKLTGPLTASELNDAQIAIIKLIQTRVKGFERK